METRVEIYEQLNEMIPALKRRKASHRVCEESGMNALLDQLCVIQYNETAEQGIGVSDPQPRIPEKHQLSQLLGGS